MPGLLGGSKKQTVNKRSGTINKMELVWMLIGGILFTLKIKYCNLFLQKFVVLYEQFLCVVFVSFSGIVRVYVVSTPKLPSGFLTSFS